MSPVTLEPQAARGMVVDVLHAYGASRPASTIVADHLVDAELCGVRSHGLLRVPQYVDEMMSGEVDATAEPALLETGEFRIRVDGGRGLGQPACSRGVAEAIGSARAGGVALVSVDRIGHAGRIGAYAEELGRAGLLSLLFCSGARSGHRVTPFNGRDPRLSTNPIAYSIPTGGVPIVGDFSTAASPEGRIRDLFNLGLQAPPDTLLDGQGRPSTDPGVLYAPEPGSILPLGGARLGHRGYALGLLVEAFATLLAGEETADGSRSQNSVAMIAIAVDDAYAARARRMAEYVLSSRPRDDVAVLLPGALEHDRRVAATGVEVDDSLWRRIAERAARRSVALPSPASAGPSASASLDGDDGDTAATGNDTTSEVQR